MCKRLRSNSIYQFSVGILCLSISIKTPNKTGVRWSLLINYKHFIPHSIKLHVIGLCTFQFSKWYFVNMYYWHLYWRDFLYIFGIEIIGIVSLLSYLRDIYIFLLTDLISFLHILFSLQSNCITPLNVFIKLIGEYFVLVNHKIALVI